MSINEQISDILRRFYDSSNKSEDHLKTLTGLIQNVSSKADNNYSSMMLFLEKTKDEQAAATNEVLNRFTSNQAAISELTERVNRSTSAHINTNRRINNLDAQQRLVSQLNGLDARIDSTLAAARQEDLILATKSVAIFNLDGQTQADADNSFRDVFGTELDSTIPPMNNSPTQTR